MDGILVRRSECRNSGAGRPAIAGRPAGTYPGRIRPSGRTEQAREAAGQAREAARRPGNTETGRPERARGRGNESRSSLARVVHLTGQKPNRTN
jgi:hypothetical protein